MNGEKYNMLKNVFSSKLNKLRHYSKCYKLLNKPRKYKSTGSQYHSSKEYSRDHFKVKGKPKYNFFLKMVWK